MSPYSLPGFSHRLPCRGPDPPAPPGPTPLVIGGQAGRAPPLTPPTGGTPLYSCFPDFGLANRGAVSGERRLRFRAHYLLLASRSSRHTGDRRSPVASKFFIPPFLGAYTTNSFPPFMPINGYRQSPSLTVYGSLRGRSAALVALFPFPRHLWPTWGFSVLSHSRLSSIPEPGGSCQMPQAFSH